MLKLIKLKKSTKMTSQLSIFTPTMNRESNIQITCEYLDSINFEGRFILVDGSDKQNKVASQYDFVDYYWKPKITMAESFVLAGIKAKTDYIMYLGDDDFALPDGCEKAIGKLKQSPLESIGFGNALWIHYPDLLAGSRPVGMTKNMKNIMFRHKLHLQLEIISGSREEKILEMIKNYRVFQFCITPMSLWKKVFNENYTRIGNPNMEELASSLALCLEAKHIKVDEYYLMRGTGHVRPNNQADHEWHRFPNLNEYKENLLIYAKSLGYDDQLSQSFMSAALALRLLGYTNYFSSKIGIQKEKKDVLMKERIKRLNNKGFIQAINKLVKV